MKTNSGPGHRAERIERSISSTSNVVPSIRVPFGARTCSFMSPASTVGKKSSPVIHPGLGLHRYNKRMAS